MRRQSHLLLLAPRSSTFVRSSLGFVLALLSTLPESARAQSTERISVSSAGAQGTGDSLHESSITADSRYVAFQSEADNLVVGDTNGWRDIFVRDLVAGTTTRVSISSSGGQSDGASFRPSISADGRWVAFESDASNLVVGDTNGVSDVFLHDRSSGETTRRSVSTGGAQGNGISYSPCLSADGQWLAFGSQATTLIALANNFGGHVFLHERATGITLLVSTSITGGLEDSTSGEPTLSANGRVIAFVSGSGNLVAGQSLYFQYAVPDPSAIYGMAFSNALRADAP